jgi:hypothetical protein
MFALFTSIVMGVVNKRDDRERLRHGLYVFGCFLVALVGLGWLMHFGCVERPLGRRDPRH